MATPVARRRRFPAGEGLAAVSGLFLFVLLFFEWYSRHLSHLQQLVEKARPGYLHGSRTATAWQAFSFIDLMLLALVLLALFPALLWITDSESRRSQIRLGNLATAAGMLSAFVILAKIIFPPGGADVKPAAWLGLAAVCGIAAGGYVMAAGAAYSRARRRPPRTATLT